MKSSIIDIINQYCFFNFRYFDYNNKLKLNLINFDHISSYLNDSISITTMMLFFLTIYILYNIQYSIIYLNNRGANVYKFSIPTKSYAYLSQ